MRRAGGMALALAIASVALVPAPASAEEQARAERAHAEPAPRLWVVPELAVLSTSGSGGASHGGLAGGADVDYWLHRFGGLRLETDFGWGETGTSEVATRRITHLTSILGVARYHVVPALGFFAGAGGGLAVAHVRHRVLGDASPNLEAAPALAWTAGVDFRLGRFLARFSASGSHHRISSDRVYGFGFGIPF